jgi:hypothetical protein
MNLSVLFVVPGPANAMLAVVIPTASYAAA